MVKYNKFFTYKKGQRITYLLKSENNLAVKKYLKKYMFNVV